MIGSSKLFFNCFISHSQGDETFAGRLYDRLRDANINCWLHNKDMKYGQDIIDPVNDVIRMRNNVLLICSEYSLKSAWVEDEIDKALAAEKDYHKQFGKKNK